MKERKRYGMIKAREQQGLSMHELSERVGMNMKYLYQVQAGKTTTEATLERIAKVLECDVKELL